MHGGIDPQSAFQYDENMIRWASYGSDCILAIMIATSGWNHRGSRAGRMKQGNGGAAADPTIWIIGDSILMEGVLACLTVQGSANLVRLTDLLTSEMPVWEKPDLIIFELGIPWVEQVAGFLPDQDSMKLLGLDRESHEVLVLDCLKCPMQSMSDLFRIVQEATGVPGTFLKGGE